MAPYYIDTLFKINDTIDNYRNEEGTYSKLGTFRWNHMNWRNMECYIEYIDNKLKNIYSM